MKINSEKTKAAEKTEVQKMKMKNRKYFHTKRGIIKKPSRKVDATYMCLTWDATWKYWKWTVQLAVQRAVRRPAQLQNSNEYWNELLTGAG